jgi:hypothetical protein
MRSASPLRRAISIPMRRNEVLHDSPLEGDGFEPSVPRQKDVWKLSFSLGSARVFSREE